MKKEFFKDIIHKRNIKSMLLFAFVISLLFFIGPLIATELSETENSYKDAENGDSVAEVSYNVQSKSYIETDQEVEPEKSEDEERIAPESKSDEIKTELQVATNDQVKRDEADAPVTLLNTIKQVTTTPTSNGQTITIEGTSPLDLSISMFDSERLVIDISDATLPQTLISKGTIPVNTAPINQLRLGQFSTEAVRIVADLSQREVVYAYERANGGNTVHITIKGTGSEPVRALSGRTIVVDPGHGEYNQYGVNPGAVGPTGLHEREVAVDISKKLARILRDKGAQVILTHEGTTNLSLAGRAQLANNNNADIFLSIHANANVNRNIGGTMTFYHNGGPNAWQSQQLARTIQNDLVRKIGLRDIGIDTANFSVLRHSNMPAALVETAFISNYYEESLLADPNFRTRTAEGIANGVVRYFQQN